MNSSENESRYGASGVDAKAAGNALSRLGAHVKRTLTLRDGFSSGRPLRGLGYYANVLDLGGGKGLAVSSDGVGTKLLVAEILGKYDTVGIDCIAMNVNDLICVGADPIAMLDYVAVGKADPAVFDELGRGLLAGCEACSITIPGGEIAQVAEMLKGHGATQGFDLVGTAVGLVDNDRALFGQHVIPGDVVVGLASAGIHSNGYSLARRVLAPEHSAYFKHESELGKTLGEELLIPTALYVAFARELLSKVSNVHAICHITGDGYMNLTRVEAPVGFVLDNFPEPQPIFQLIETRGRISKAEMYSGWRWAWWCGGIASRASGRCSASSRSCSTNVPG
jgi:phosphoribosylformylglycinamidine cyclo-ligase